MMNINSLTLSNGEVMNGLRDLAKALEGMGYDTFSHHVNDDKNDFSDWIHKRFKKHDLGKRLRGVNDPKSMAAIINIFINKESLGKNSINNKILMMMKS
jgi:hypothetical protein